MGMIQMNQVLHMKGGEGKQSYSHNSTPQRLAVSKIKEVLEETLGELCFSEEAMADCIKVADLGCSLGSNTLAQVKDIIDCVDKSYAKRNKKKPTIQVFLNDLEGNDFNTLFKSFPIFYEKVEQQRTRRQFFIAAVPGSFYGRLFPDRSMHFFSSCNSLQWLSQVPEELVTKSGVNLNKDNISLAKTSSPDVHKAYLNQFEKDFTVFLEARGEELVHGGCLALSLVSQIDADDGYENKELIGLVLYDMVMEGVIKKCELESFNLPQYCPSGEEVKMIVKKEGSFKIIRLEISKHRWSDIYQGDNSKGDRIGGGEYISMFIRAIFEPILSSHFGQGIMDELFSRYAKRATDYMEMGGGFVNHMVISLVKNQ